MEHKPRPRDDNAGGNLAAAGGRLDVHFSQHARPDFQLLKLRPISMECLRHEAHHFACRARRRCGMRCGMNVVGSFRTGHGQRCITARNDVSDFF